eukprot:361604-Chlamydomonas_euryale.AAC.3
MTQPRTKSKDGLEPHHTRTEVFGCRPHTRHGPTDQPLTGSTPTRPTTQPYTGPTPTSAQQASPVPTQHAPQPNNPPHIHLGPTAQPHTGSTPPAANNQAQHKPGRRLSASKPPNLIPPANHLDRPPSFQCIPHTGSSCRRSASSSPRDSPFSSVTSSQSTLLERRRSRIRLSRISVSAACGHVARVGVREAWASDRGVRMSRIWVSATCGVQHSVWGGDGGGQGVWGDM